MPILAFNHFNLRAERALLDNLRDFYVEIVGLRVGNRPPFGTFGYWLYVGDQPVLHLSEASVDELRQPSDTSTFDHVAFSCDDLAAFESHLNKHHVKYTRVEVPGSSQIQLFVKDPAGNGVEFNFLQLA